MSFSVGLLRFSRFAAQVDLGSRAVVGIVSEEVIWVESDLCRRRRRGTLALYFLKRA